MRIKTETLEEPLTNGRKHPMPRTNWLTRRQAIAGVAVALVGGASASNVFAENQPAASKDTPGAAASDKITALHQEVNFKASPRRIYEVLLDSKQFAAFTGIPAEIDPKAGGAFSMFKGMIVGRNVELIPDQRIVQAWRPTHWDPGKYSIVKFELKPQGPETTVILDHTGFPEGEFDHLFPGWKLRYWDPLGRFLAT